MCLVGIAEAFQNASGIVGHGGVATAFGNDDVAVAAGVHVGVEIVVGKEGGQRHRAVEDLDLWLLGPEKNRAASRALVSKYGKMLLTSFFISLYWPGSVIRSMAKKTWNFGLGALPPLFSFI